jgi:GxxExxY protein
MKKMMLLHEDLTGKVIKAFYTVYNTLGYGFLEKVYRNSLAWELEKIALSVAVEYPIPVFYDGRNVGSFFADIVVNNLVILELKSAETIREEHEAQLINYLRATSMEVGLLLNFGRKAEFRRKVYMNLNKPNPS